MKKRLFLYTIFIVFSGLLVFFAVSVYITYSNNLSLAKETVMEATQIYAGLYSDKTDISLFVKVGGDMRVTIVSPEGIVMADSHPFDVGTLENHLNRPEIKAAANRTPTTFIRHSDTLGVDLIYYALRVKSGDSYVFVRVAIPVAKIGAYLYRSLPLLIFLLIIVVLLCFYFARSMVDRTLKPFGAVEQRLRLLLNGEYAPSPVAESYEETDIIIRNIDEIALIFQKSIEELRDEKSKLDYILNNIGDGLFVADANKVIVLINDVALEIFDVTSNITGKNLNYLSYDKTLIGAVDDCMSLAKNTLFELTLNGRTYLVTVKRLPDTELTMVVLSDVTENRENAKRREEFFANASHELKTPLTAIKGFNELTVINNKDESISKYIDSITRETERMLTLIGDMLKLSELENTKSINAVPVILSQIVSDVRETVSSAINEKSIIFEVVGDGTVTAEQKHVYELVKNLVENAVRYNDQGGRVSVKIESERNRTRLIVSDNGIGISSKEQIRIFERFYRVEKSRSQQSGGTGLGLSIVKHICALYNWKLSLKSKLGTGTEITVLFD